MQATRLSVSADESYMCAAVAVKCFNNTDAKEFATRRSHVKSGKALCVFAKCLSFGHFIYTCICSILYLSDPCARLLADDFGNLQQGV